VLFNDGFEGPRGAGYREVILWNGNELGGKGTACEGDVFENNTFVNTVPSGHKLNQLVESKQGTKDCVFRNNIFAIRGKPVFTLEGFEGFVFENNCLQRIGGGEEVAKGGSLVEFCKTKGLKESGTISKDPMFADLEKGDLTLKDGSPCLGAGATRDGKPRDIGAFQRGSDMQIGCRLPWKKSPAGGEPTPGKEL
jgi:hypothetical protein